MVEHVKVVIKGGKSRTSHEKLRALNILDRCVTSAQGNREFIDYVRSKILKRLRIMAAYCPSMYQVSDVSNLGTRGAFIFRADEPDTEHSSEFLRRLLVCIRGWAELFQGDVSPFAMAYRELRARNVSFPEVKPVNRPLVANNRRGPVEEVKRMG